MLILMAPRTFVLALLAVLCWAEELPLVDKVEFQPLAAQVARVVQTLEMLGEPLPAADAQQLKAAKTIEQIQRILDKHCLAGVEINPESRVKVQQGPAKLELVEQGWRAFLIKVQQPGWRNGGPGGGQPQRRAAAEHAGERLGVRDGSICRCSNKQPMKAHLSGLELEYRVLQIYAKEAGKREGKLIFDVGQGSQDLGFRSEVDILFTITAFGQGHASRARFRR